MRIAWVAILVTFLAFDKFLSYRVSIFYNKVKAISKPISTLTGIIMVSVLVGKKKFLIYFKKPPFYFLVYFLVYYTKSLNVFVN